MAPGALAPKVATTLADISFKSTFESGKAEILQEMMPLLDKIAEALRSANESVIIAGHTDNVPLRGGRYQSNLGLSIARAATVAEYLIQKNRLDQIGEGGWRASQESDNRKYCCLFRGLASLWLVADKQRPPP